MEEKARVPLGHSTVDDIWLKGFGTGAWTGFGTGARTAKTTLNLRGGLVRVHGRAACTGARTATLLETVGAGWSLRVMGNSLARTSPTSEKHWRCCIQSRLRLLPSGDSQSFLGCGPMGNNSE
jgi:hypothetical protein